METRKLLIGLVLSLTCSLASANLITNGSFETFPQSPYGYGSANTWQIYDEIEGWDATRTIEVWKDGFLGVNAPDQNYFVELNAHPRNHPKRFSIFQDITTEIGQAYELSFWARARNNNSEKFRVNVGGDLNSLITQHVVGEWRQFIYTFVASEAISQVRFTSMDRRRDTTGNLLDHIVVTKVPEPGTIVLLILGIVGLFMQRKLMANLVAKKVRSS